MFIVRAWYTRVVVGACALHLSRSQKISHDTVDVDPTDAEQVTSVGRLVSDGLEC